jgi:hypothetical protein
MRLGFVRSYRLAVVSAALLAASCNDNPVSFDTKDTSRLEINPTTMVIPGGRTTKLEVRPVNAGRQPTFADVAWTVTNCGDAASIDVAVDPDQLELQPPGLLIVTANTQLGSNCVDVTGGGVTGAVDVVVTAEAVAIDSAPTVLRAGETGTVYPRIITADSTTMTPFELSHVVFTSDNEDVATIDATGFVETETAGAALLTATWLPDSVGVDLSGAPPRAGSAALEVVANVPDSAFLDVGVAFGAFAVPDSADGEVIVLDEFGNVNQNPAEILDIFAVSDAPATATVDAEIRQTEDPLTGEISARAVMRVQIVGTGVANISGTVTTSEGVFDWGPALAVGADPQIAAVTPATGGFAESVTITGSGFVDGFTTVFVRRVDTGVNYDLGNFTVDNLTTITAQMPTWTVPGAFEITADVGGIVSATSATWTQTNTFDESATEDNSFWNTGGQADISVPALIDGSLIGEPDDGLFGKMADWLFFTISGGTRTLAYENTPLGTEDMEYAVIDGGFNFIWCTDDHTGPGSPDGGECVLPGLGEPIDGETSTGTWWLIPQEWGNVDTTYRLTITMAED